MNNETNSGEAKIRKAFAIAKEPRPGANGATDAAVAPAPSKPPQEQWRARADDLLTKKTSKKKPLTQEEKIELMEALAQLRETLYWERRESAANKLGATLKDLDLTVKRHREEIAKKERTAKANGKTKTKFSAASERPFIIVNGRQLPDVTHDVLAALEKANNPPAIFVHGTSLVRVVYAGRGKKKHPVIDTLTEPVTRGVAARASRLLRNA
jgi:hypothetical protein